MTTAEKLNDLNPYLQGLYAPVSEEVTAERLVVHGEIPRDLNGLYVRNGPNPARPPVGMHHWFDGDGMLHGIRFEDGEARYMNRYVRAADFGPSGDARPGIFSRAEEAAGRTTVYRDTGNTDVIVHGDRLLALWYVSGRPVAIDPETLETIRVEDFRGELPNNVSAHSKTCPVTGELIFFDYDLYEPFMSVGAVSAANELTHFKRIELPGPRLPHDMGLTEHFAILHDLPVVFTEQGIRNRMWQIHVADQPTRFGVVPRPRDGNGFGKSKWFEFPTCYIYHVINCWEEGDEVVMAACKMVDNGLNPNPAYGPYAPMVDVLALRAQPFLWRMNMKTGEGREERLDDALSEFPVVNLDWTGAKTRSSYHVVMDDCDLQRYSALRKYDLSTGGYAQHDFAPGVYGSEPAFAPRDGNQGRGAAAAEDDGYVVTFATSLETGASEALVIDARDFAAPPVARVALPVRVPAGFHGTWAALK
ncbi:MAG: 9-cis-epoxycarotenoid dioxygenase [Alphaproteobacteria bacterium]|nr:9-cis-epoxycarotenoid dioxygenase [Alphaproteobacteria bacterium]